ncbi:flagellar hook-associated protein FlgL [Anaeromicrobium sediminis]|uniref:Flagellar hook-associated protein 3 n=1 Tax=Anaeromicrobium sediminis TaxID=1478221 RepID=A0A267MKK2_9FIRM|nr:flagellar hook-associated protein FlgL [Anaeromicrobium sediminis]PAB60121.1 flagellar hook-associated protein 3 [Anaeromicrobium sediminis]
MRVTNSMLSQNVIWNINKNLTYMNELNIQMATGKKIQKPSDDPVCTAKSLEYRTYISQIEQYEKNAEDALGWMKVTEQALDGIEDVIGRTRELTVQASSESLSESDYEVIAIEIEQLEAQLIEIGNYSYAGRYVFGGYGTNTLPFEVIDTPVGDEIMYKDSYLSLGGPYAGSVEDDEILAFYSANEDKILTEDDKNQDIMYNIGRSSEVDVNVEGYEIFGDDEKGIFGTFQKIEMALAGETEYKVVNDSVSPPVVETYELELTELLEDLDENLNQVLAVRADLGAKMSYVELTQNRLSDEYVTYTGLMSMNEDVDMAEVAMELASAQSVYEASLAAGSKIILPSLADFIT